MPRRLLSSSSLPTIAVGISAFLSGIASYALVLLAARTLPVVANDTFAVFWSIAVIVGLGAYFPVEQEMSRRGTRISAAGGSATSLIRAALIIVAVISAVVVGAAVFAPLGGEASGLVITVALAAACAGYSAQFTAKGLLSAQRQTVRYAIVVGLEAILRIALAAVLFAVGSQQPILFCLVVGVAAVLSVAPAMGLRRPGPRAASEPVGAFAGSVSQLVLAALSVQLLLGSPVLLSSVGGAASPGSALAALTIARIPVFIYQASQVLIVPRIAHAIEIGERESALRLTIGLVGSAIAIATLLVVGFAIAGREVVQVLFGTQLVPDAEVMTLIASAVGVFLVALCASDSLMATGPSHHWIVAAWVIGLGAGAVAAVLTFGTPSGAVVPLLVGSASTFAVLVVRISAVYRHRAHREGAAR